MDIEIIKERIVYNEKTGEFFHSNNMPSHLAGKRCGTITKQNSGIKYILLRVKYKQYLAHRVAYLLTHGEIPEGLEIDHINQNGLDNRACNLRAVSRTENQRNKRRIIAKRGGGVGVLGVHFDSNRGKFKATIRFNGKQITIGRYDDIFDAICARMSAENKYWK